MDSITKRALSLFRRIAIYSTCFARAKLVPVWNRCMKTLATALQIAAVFATDAQKCFAFRMSYMQFLWLYSGAGCRTLA